MMAEPELPDTLKHFDAMGRMAGAVAHDFNNLLTGILGNLELLQRRAKRLGLADFDDYLRGSRSAANRAVDLTQRLLAVSGHLALEPKILRVEQVLEDAIEVLSSSLPASIQVKTQVTPPLWPVRCDQAQLDEALLQLVRNAQTAMPEGGQVTISARNAEMAGNEYGFAPGSYVAISVTDTGTGMSDIVAARAFEPFFTTRNSGAGTGLGLASVLGFARQSGGHAGVEETRPGMTKVTIYLPRNYLPRNT
jgi:signal transduction histidine kinase